MKPIYDLTFNEDTLPWLMKHVTPPGPARFVKHNNKCPGKCPGQQRID